jgi:S1-C subfamily serine protease
MADSLRLFRNGACGILALACIFGTPAAAQPRAEAEPPGAISLSAERVYAAARPRLMQIRTLVAAAGRQSSIGSGFLVGADGLAITNYHVVSQHALEPANYRLEYTMADNARGELKLVAIDIANDLAVVRLDRSGDAHFEFDARTLAGGLSKGERLYSMGNPLNLGFTIVEGTYNGQVENSYAERVLFSGAINPGMSGGPAVTSEGRVAGVNVAKRTDGELVSFLVPARFAVELLDRARTAPSPSPQTLRAEIGRQLTEWQAGLYRRITEIGFRSSRFGPYQASESAAPWFTCWAQTNAGQVPKPRAIANATICNSATRLFVSGDLHTGAIQIQHTHYRSIDLNAFQFAAFITENNRPLWFGGWHPKWYTRQRCHEDFVALAEAASHPPLRVAWCARAHREFDGLYDVWVVAVTQDRSTEALVSRLNMQAVTHENALALANLFLDSLQWTK